MKPRSEQEWWVVASIFTLHVLMALLLFIIWIGLAVMVFFAVAWLVAML